MGKSLSFSNGQRVFSTNREANIKTSFAAGEVITAGQVVTAYSEEGTVKVKPVIAVENNANLPVGVALNGGIIGEDIEVVSQGSATISGIGTGVTEFPATVWGDPSIAGGIILSFEETGGEALVKIGTLLDENTLIVEVGKVYILNPTGGDTPQQVVPTGFNWLNPNPSVEDSNLEISVMDTGPDLVFIFQPKQELLNIIIEEIHVNGYAVAYPSAYVGPQGTPSNAQQIYAVVATGGVTLSEGDTVHLQGRSQDNVSFTWKSFPTNLFTKGSMVGNSEREATTYADILSLDTGAELLFIFTPRVPVTNITVADVKAGGSVVASPNVDMVGGIATLGQKYFSIGKHTSERLSPGVTYTITGSIKAEAAPEAPISYTAALLVKTVIPDDGDSTSATVGDHGTLAFAYSEAEEDIILVFTPSEKIKSLYIDAILEDGIAILAPALNICPAGGTTYDRTYALNGDSGISLVGGKSYVVKGTSQLDSTGEFQSFETEAVLFPMESHGTLTGNLVGTTPETRDIIFTYTPATELSNLYIEEIYEDGVLIDSPGVDILAGTPTSSPVNYSLKNNAGITFDFGKVYSIVVRSIDTATSAEITVGSEDVLFPLSASKDGITIEVVGYSDLDGEFKLKFINDRTDPVNPSVHFIITGIVINGTPFVDNNSGQLVRNILVDNGTSTEFSFTNFVNVLHPSWFPSSLIVNKDDLFTVFISVAIGGYYLEDIAIHQNLIFMGDPASFESGTFIVESEYLVTGDIALTFTRKTYLFGAEITAVYIDGTPTYPNISASLGTVYSPVTKYLNADLGIDISSGGVFSIKGYSKDAFNEVYQDYVVHCTRSRTLLDNSVVIVVAEEDNADVEFAIHPQVAVDSIVLNEIFGDDISLATPGVDLTASAGTMDSVYASLIEYGITPADGVVYKINITVVETLSQQSSTYTTDVIYHHHVA